MEEKIYYTFIRNWYKRVNGRIVPNTNARKTVGESGLTYDEARRWCENYNKSHAPGVLSRKAEFTSK